MEQSRSVLILTLTTAITAAGLLLLGCDGEGRSSPTSPERGGTITLSAASVTVGGQVFQAGDTFSHEHGAHGGVTRFEATLMGPNGPAAGHVVEVQFRRPGGMMNESGIFHLYDDGTHGDHVPADGVYCFEDPAGLYGFHHQGALHGRYHYDFCGLYANGAETNHWVIAIDVVD